MDQLCLSFAINDKPYLQLSSQVTDQLNMIPDYNTDEAMQNSINNSVSKTTSVN